MWQPKSIAGIEFYRDPRVRAYLCLQHSWFQLNFPVTISKLHGDVLSEVNLLSRNLNHVKTAENIRGYYTHLGPGKTRFKTISMTYHRNLGQ